MLVPLPVSLSKLWLRKLKLEVSFTLPVLSVRRELIQRVKTGKMIRSALNLINIVRVVVYTEYTGKQSRPIFS